MPYYELRSGCALISHHSKGSTCRNCLVASRHPNVACLLVQGAALNVKLLMTHLRPAHAATRTHNMCHRLYALYEVTAPATS